MFQDDLRAWHGLPRAVGAPMLSGTHPRDARRTDQREPGAAGGLRRGEVLGLGWDEVDSETDVLSIQRQVQRVDGALALVDVKTRAGRRSLPPWARDALTDSRVAVTTAVKGPCR